MKDDYLWDRSGEPDAEIERLERTLGRLRYQPRQQKPLELPVLRTPRRHFFPGFAVAAALAMMVLTAGMWLALSRSGETTARRLSVVRPTQDSLAGLYGRAESFDRSMRAVEARGQNANAGASQAERASLPRRKMHESRAESFVARRARRERRDERLMREGEAATEKLMMALRYASSKLNLVQRQIQVNKENGPAS